MTGILYFAMLGFLLTHELDAMKRHEWRIFPMTTFLSDQTGEAVFLWVHVPLFALLFYFGAGDPTGSVAIGLAVFAVVHVGLHWLFRRHPKYEFNNPTSWGLILGAGLAGAGHLILVASLV